MRPLRGPKKASNGTPGCSEGSREDLVVQRKEKKTSSGSSTRTCEQGFPIRCIVQRIWLLTTEP